jgi:hypothetical protein
VTVTVILLRTATATLLRAVTVILLKVVTVTLLRTLMKIDGVSAQALKLYMSL